LLVVDSFNRLALCLKEVECLEICLNLPVALHLNRMALRLKRLKRRQIRHK
jgi:hypothetical protein